MIKIAVTGGAGSGKTSVCNRFKELSVKVISSDILAREAVAEGSTAYNKIVNYFGKKVLTEDGSLNRRMLRRIIINDNSAKEALESFIHPEITKLMHSHIIKAEKDENHIVMVEVPLLFELGIEGCFDIVIVVIADRKLRIKRLMDRDDVSREDAEALLNHQLPDEDKAARAEFVIKNDGSFARMIRSVDHLYKDLVKKYVKELESA
ncbi:MAG: dephospho-CoA kinase [Desulfobacterales bacterium]|nr:dephospho-CoA kinase [Desulfobacterales bacterium]